MLHPLWKGLAKHFGSVATKQGDMAQGKIEATFERQDESVPSLFGRLTDQLMQLVDAKLELLKVELKEEAGAYAAALGIMLGGVVIATVGFAVFNVAIAFFISTLFEGIQWSPATRYGLGFIITAAIYLAVGTVIIVVAKNRLAKQRLAPKSAADLKRDQQFLRQEF